tara:strand:- start:2163 stop:2783 length:621 start_codon:yes stop_codon:yes gene_type:complete
LYNEVVIEDEEFLSSIFGLFCKLEKSIPNIQIKKQELINLGKELSESLNHPKIKKDTVQKDKEFLFSLPIKLGYVDVTTIITEKNNFQAENPPSNIPSNDIQWLENINKAVQEKIIKNGKTWSVVASDFNITQKKLRQKVKNLSGLSLIKFQNKIQFQIACSLLKENKYMSISNVSNYVGFRDSKYFSKKFKQYYGMLPCEYRRKK